MKKSNVISMVISQILFMLLLPLFWSLFRYLHPIVFFVIWCCLTSFVFFMVYWIKREKIIVSKRAFIIALGIYTLGLLILLFLRPSNQNYDSYNLMPFSTILFYLSGVVKPLIAVYNLMANVGLFLPYGIAFFLLIRKIERLSIARLIGTPFIIITIIECMQFITHRGSLDVDDLILNMAGVGIGYVLSPIVRRVIVLY